MRKRTGCMLLSFVLSMSMIMPVHATKISDTKAAKNQTEKELNNVNKQIDSLNSQKANLAGEIAQMDSQLVDILTSISICEDEIEQKEKQIVQAKSDLEAAIVKEEEQNEAMKARLKFMYEHGNGTYLDVFLQSKNFTDLLNNAQYVEKLYSYDQDLLHSFEEAKVQVKDLKEQLESEEAELLASNYELGEEKKALENLIASKKSTMKNFDAELASAKKEASAFKDKLKKQTEKLREQEAALAAQIAKKEKEKNQTAMTDSNGNKTNVNTNDNGTATSDTPNSNNNDTNNSDNSDKGTDAPSGGGNSSLGKQIASYACQFVGNPYKAGGTSLTNGADCSGFVQSVYRQFGYNLPRDSTSQRGAGRAVDYANAQPGDIICYAGHVAIYLGGGSIVHASTERTGIKYGTATYRTILSVRRIV